VTAAPTIGVTIEARMTSSRLPGKVLLEASGKPMLELMVERLKRATMIDKIVIATTTNDGDDPIEELAHRLNIGVHRGSEHDVLNRVLGAAQNHDIDVIVELTGDCPLIDPSLIDDCIAAYRRSGVDYCSNILTRAYPIGMDTQVFSTAVLADVAQRTDDPDDHEHVSLFIYRHPEIYSLNNVPAPDDMTWPDLRLTLDTPEDFELILAVFDNFYETNPAFGLSDILAYLKSNPGLVALNENIAHRYV